MTEPSATRMRGSAVFFKKGAYDRNARPLCLWTLPVSVSVDARVAPFLMGSSGNNNWNDNNGNGSYGGSAFVSFNWGPSNANWYIGVRVK